MAASLQLEVLSKQPTGEARPTPLLFVHGAWHAAWCWDEYFMPYFASVGYASYAVSWRGHGGSEKRGSLKTTSLAALVADVAQAADYVADQAGARPVVIGHSLGGFVTQRYLQKHKAAGAVLIAPMPAKGSMAGSLRVFRHEPLNFLKANLVMDLYPLVDTVPRAKWGLFSSDELAARYQPRLQSEAYLAYAQTLIPLPPVRPANVPMLVLAAADDNIFSIGEALETAKRHGAEYQVIPSAHDMMIEPAWQQAAERIYTWLQAHRF